VGRVRIVLGHLGERGGGGGDIAREGVWAAGKGEGVREGRGGLREGRGGVREGFLCVKAICLILSGLHTPRRLSHGITSQCTS
jgi:hypothetical protein